MNVFLMRRVGDVGLWGYANPWSRVNGVTMIDTHTIFDWELDAYENTYHGSMHISRCPLERPFCSGCKYDNGPNCRGMRDMNAHQQKLTELL